MTKRADEELLGSLHLATAKLLLAKIKSGEATPAEIGAAIKFLANNKIEAERVPDSPLDRLTKSLPVFDDEQDEASIN